MDLSDEIKQKIDSAINEILNPIMTQYKASKTIPADQIKEDLTPEEDNDGISLSVRQYLSDKGFSQVEKEEPGYKDLSEPVKQYLMNLNGKGISGKNLNNK